MKMGAIAQNPLEWAALKSGLVPTPLAYSHFGFMMSKFLLEATDKGVFETIGKNKVSLKYIADACKLNERALESLLGVLASMGLVETRSGLFLLTHKSKKWLLKDSPHSLYWLLIFDNKVCLKWMDYVGEFLETGKGLQYHDTFNEEEWFYYQKAMEATAAITSSEAVRKIPVPANATNMLDIGGAHGLYSVALCKKHIGLHSTILDLPGAVEKAIPILEKYGMNDVVQHRPGNILTDELEEGKYDLIIMANVAHHFTEEENVMVARKVYRALKPGAYFSIIEILRQNKIRLNSDMLGAMGDFFFALSSTSGTWSLEEIMQWQSTAGFRRHTNKKFLSIPGYIAITAKKV
jgi:2-polyprenyl-3-methyl-5-hydroxy-6-metoxy-1,4-benzoquinol methylase